MSIYIRADDKPHFIAKGIIKDGRREQLTVKSPVKVFVRECSNGEERNILAAYYESLAKPATAWGRGNNEAEAIFRCIHDLQTTPVASRLRIRHLRSVK